MAKQLSTCASPQTQGVKYVGRENKGFCITPKSDSAPDGWGKPLIDTDGNPITPGTPGGPDTVKFIGKSGTRPWGHRNTPGTQLFGEISWKGKRKHPTQTHKGNWVLTFHGPNSRYFPSDSFSYGSEDKHNNVYCEGRCIAVAPFPVLGAALSIAIGETGEKEYTLRVICYNGYQDVAYMKKVSPTMGVDSEGYTDEFRQAQMKLYVPLTYESGWVTAGYMACISSSQGTGRSVKAPRTPWFFDSTGTVAQCMREADITLNRGDKEVTQQGYVRYKATFSGAGVSLSVPDNTTGFQWQYKVKVEQLPNMVRNTKVPALAGYSQMRTHYWRVHKIKFEAIPSGSYIVAVDYDDTEEKLLKAEATGKILFEQYFYKGIDSSIDPEMPPDERNDQSLYVWTGDYYTYYINTILGGNTPYHGDGWLCVALLQTASLYLSGEGFTPDRFWLSRQLSGSMTQFLTGISDPNDIWLYFTFHSYQYLHSLSLAPPHRAYRRDETLYQKDDAGKIGRYRARSEHYSTAETIDYGTAAAFSEKPFPYSENTTDRYNVDGRQRHWQFADLEANWMGGADQNRIFYCVDWAFPMDFSVPSSEPSPLAFEYGSAYPFVEGGKWLTIPDLLQSVANNQFEGQLATDTLGHFCVSMKYLDENDNEKYYNALDGDTGQLDSLTSASGDNIKHYPLGEL